ncbi:MAG: hypothetical protein OEY44_01775, partial [Candidatus Peregrinibacteria bacterium]|nr:hypothetical protein [Candidatus Peregrinibacteria bacterium]
MRLTRDNRGVSLPLVIGLTMLLVLITTTLNELVIRALRSAHQIEASDRAYFAAEAGIEDALYELSAHSAGYETQASLGEADVRSDDFTQNVLWANEWEIKNKGLNDCAQMDDWEAGFLPGYCGRLFGGQKLIINLFADDALSVGVGTSAVNETVADIGTLSVSNFVLKLRLPKEVVLDNGLTTLRIDNDRDLGS